MKKLIKRLIWTLITLVFLLVLTIGAVLILFNPNDYKTDITQAVKKHTGLTLKINGKITLDVFPHLALVLNQVNLSNRYSHFIKAKTVAVSIALWPLLDKKIRVDSINLNNANLTLLTGLPSSTQINQLEAQYGISYSAKAAAEYQRITHQKSALTRTEPASSWPSFTGFSVHAITLANTAVHLLNTQTDASSRITITQLNAYNVQQNTPFRVKFKVQYQADKQQASISGSTEINYNPNREQISLKDLSLDGKAAVQKQLIPFSLKTHALLNNHQHVLNLSPVDLTLNHSLFELSLKATHYLTLPVISVKARARNVPVQPLVALFTTHAILTGNLTLSAQLNTQGFDLKSWLSHLSGKGNYVIGQGALAGIDVNYYTQLARALAKHQTTANLVNTQKTPFKTIEGHFTASKGIINNTLTLASGQVSTHSTGTINLAKHALKLQFNIGASPTLAIPLSVTGSFNSPQVRLDTQKLLKAQAEQALKQAKANLAQRISKAVHQNVKLDIGQLKKFFG